ncbi:MAG: DUF1501 domain-containing protein [Pirellulales bacterium]
MARNETLKQSWNMCSSPALDRRRFIESALVGAGGLGIVAAGPQSWLSAMAAAGKNSDRVLVVIQLSGGNDGLNTVIPFKNESYRKARPKLAIAESDVLKINDELGFHPALRGAADLLESGTLSFIQGVGYDKPNRSHFESMDIWHTCARKQTRTGEGWIGRWFSQQAKSNSDFGGGLHLGGEQQPAALVSRDVPVPSVASLAQFRLQLPGRDQVKQQLMDLVRKHASQPSAGSARAAEEMQAADDLLSFVQSNTQAAIDTGERLEAAAKGSLESDGFPATQLGEKLHIVAQLIAGELPTRVYYVTLDGFDTHAQQAPAHTGLLRQWSDATAAFVKFLNARGHGDRTLVFTFSEFGRRVAENASDGTDHGAAAPVFLVGPKLNSGPFGALPSLNDLDDGDLKFHTDFRRVYASIIEGWFESPSESVLGAQYKPLDIWS